MGDSLLQLIAMDDNQKTLSQIKDLSGLINGHLAGIDRQKGQLRQVKEMLESILTNDQAYQEADSKAKEEAKERAKVKARILQQPQAHDLNFKIKEHRLEIKQLSDELSSFLAQYQKLTGATEFEGDDGEMRQIVFTAKLVGKTHFNEES